MCKRYAALVSILLLVCTAGIHAQDSLPVSFSFDKHRINATELVLKIKVLASPGVKLYALQKSSEDALYSTISFDSSAHVTRATNFIETGDRKTEKENSIDADVNYFLDSAIWQQTIKVNPSDSFVLKGSINYMYKKGDEFIPGAETFKYFIQPENITGASSEKTVTVQSLLWIFLAAFAGGLLALLTPCVYSMIPVTVSFFTKRSKTKAEGIRNALYYAVSIVTIFTLLGFLITLIFGPAALNNLATNWIANLVFFSLFLVFGFSFLGAFEISLPPSWTNKSDSKAGTKSFLGIFFMALTLVLVSFSCTGPIIGNLLVLAAKGSYWGPLTGMFGFSLALALPFALFAFFPSFLPV